MKEQIICLVDDNGLDTALPFTLENVAMCEIRKLSNMERNPVICAVEDDWGNIRYLSNKSRKSACEYLTTLLAKGKIQ